MAYEKQKATPWRRGFGGRLGEAILRRFGTQKAFAEEFGVSRAAVSTWVGGTSVPELQQFALLCSVLGVDPAELLGLGDNHDEEAATEG